MQNEARPASVTVTPSADLSQVGPPWSLRGEKSGRDIKIGDVVSEADGFLVLTVAGRGSLPSGSVVFVECGV